MIVLDENEYEELTGCLDVIIPDIPTPFSDRQVEWLFDALDYYKKHQDKLLELFKVMEQ